MKDLILMVLSLGLVAADEIALQEFTTGNNLFSASLYQEVLKDNQENFLISPFSIQTVLALTQSGAKGETSAEIRTALRLPNSTQATEAVYSSLLPTLKRNEYYTLYSANKIYVKNNYSLNENFQKIANDIYQAGVENINFAQKLEAAASMNDWVEKQTENKIHNLLDPRNLDEDTAVVLINALYFKGEWVTPFDSYSTSKKTFFKTAKDTVQVDTMYVTDVFNYYESPELDAKFLELLYKGSNASMTIVLPNKIEGLANLENQIEKVFSSPQFTQERVSVSLPKFTMESKIQLKTILQNIGINKAFNEEADLSGIAGQKGDLRISDVVQKTFINVTETGTEAAAATAEISRRQSRSFWVKRQENQILTVRVASKGTQNVQPNFVNKKLYFYHIFLLKNFLIISFYTKL